MIIGYVDNEEALAYISERYDHDITQAQLDKALYLSLDKIEEIDVRYSGKSENDTGLIFPRLCEDEVPDNVKNAQVLEAYSIAINGGNPEPDMAKGENSRSISDMSISYDRSFKVGNIEFLNVAASKIIDRYRRKTYGSSSI